MLFLLLCQPLKVCFLLLLTLQVGRLELGIGMPLPLVLQSLHLPVPLQDKLFLLLLVNRAVVEACLHALGLFVEELLLPDDALICRFFRGELVELHREVSLGFDLLFGMSLDNLPLRNDAVVRLQELLRCECGLPVNDLYLLLLFPVELGPGRGDLVCDIVFPRQLLDRPRMYSLLLELELLSVLSHAVALFLESVVLATELVSR